ncbi:MAG TPA: DASS family sodium-coupled anion symporter [Xanthobacteraceae bacterium]|nr:DASS family sodium-coupled anion symporter [Xanthobacteraceae bacterium]
MQSTITATAAPRDAASRTTPRGATYWCWALPVLIAVVIALIPPPTGLGQHAWWYFAVFAGVVAALIIEPVPPAATGFIAIALTAALSRWTLFSAADLAKPNFNIASESVKWAFSGFASNTVWLVGGAFMLALGYEKTGLGRRVALLLVRALGRNSLMLGYAATFSDAILALVTPSNTARSAGTMFPIMINLPPIYDSKPNDPSARKIGSYVLWTTFAASCITSSLFITGCAPNFLAADFVRKLAHVDITWTRWFFAAAPFGIPLLLALPVIGYVLYPPTLKQSPEIPVWAGRQLHEMGTPSRDEWILAGLVLIAIALWILAADYFDAAVVAFMVISVMLIARVVTWDDLAKNNAAWTTIALLATLVAMADGLARVGFIKWFADFVAAHVGGLPPTMVLVALITVYFFSHYCFSSLTAHTTAMMPIMLGVGLSIPGLAPEKLAVGLALTTGIMGVIAPYATGAALPYYNCGYITSAEFWRNGSIYGLVFLAALLLLGVPWL